MCGKHSESLAKSGAHSTNSHLKNKHADWQSV